MKRPVERKVLRVFGKVIRPANWIIFISGFLLVFYGASTLWWEISPKTVGAILIALQGIDFAISGYGEIKDDEDIEGE